MKGEGYGREGARNGRKKGIRDGEGCARKEEGGVMKGGIGRRKGAGEEKGGGGGYSSNAPMNETIYTSASVERKKGL